jgi:TP901 family phage tail tape measure protein
MALTVADLVVKLSGDPRQFERQMAKAAQKVEAFGKKMKAQGRTMTMSMSLPLLAIGGAAIKMSADFDAALSKIVGLVGVSRESVNAWKDDIKALSVELGRAPIELAEAMYNITSAGARGTEALNVLRASAQAAAAGLGETKSIGFAAGAAVAAFGEESLDAELAVATMVATIREGNLEAASLTPVLGNVMSTAANLGLSFDQVGAAIAAMTRLGTDAATSTTALRGILSSILKPSKQASDALLEMGTSTEELKRQMRDEGLFPTLKTLSDLMETNASGMEVVFGNVRALTGAFNLVGENAATTEKIFASLAATTKDDLAKALEAAEETDLHKLNQAVSQLKVTMMELGEVLAPTIIPLIQDLATGLKSLGDWFASLNPAMQKLLATTGLITIALGPLLWGVGATIAALGVMSKAMVAATVATAGLGTSMQVTGIATGKELLLLRALPVAALAAKAGLVGLVAYLSYEGAQAFLKSIGYYKAMGKALGLEATPPLHTFTEELKENKKLFDSHLYTYTQMRKSLGMLGAEWAVASDHSDENAERLANLTVKLEAVAKAAREVSDSKLGMPEAKELITNITEEIDKQTASLKAQYDLMSKADVKKRLQELATEYKTLVDSGINAEQVAAAQADEMIKLLDLHKQYGLEAPDSVKKYAKAMKDSGVPLTDEMLEKLGNMTTYVSIGMKKASEMGEDLRSKVSKGLSGGFGIGIEKGIAYADQKMAEWQQAREPFIVKFVPDYEALDDWIEGLQRGQYPHGGGKVP